MKRETLIKLSLAALVLMVLSTRTSMAETNDTGTIGALYHNQAEKRDISGIELMPGVTMGILLEVEASYEKQGTSKSSDIALATFAAAIDAELKSNIKGHVLLLWEEDDTEPLDVDEGYIELGNSDSTAFAIKAGKMYVPFGALHSHFVSDPIVLEMGETRESAIVASYGNDLLNISIATFNGELDDSDDDQADDLVAALDLAPLEGIELGIYWISDIGESDFMQEAISANIESAEETATEEGIISEDAILPYNDVSAIGGYLHIELGHIRLDAEHMAATDDYNAGLLAETEASPESWNIELGTTLFESVEVAIKCEGSDDVPEMPEKQTGIAGSYAFANNMAFSLEYLRGEFKDSDNERDLISAQLAMEF